MNKKSRFLKKEKFWLVPMVHQFHSRQSPPFVRASYKKSRTNLLKRGLQVYYFIAKSIKEVDEICRAQLYIASKMAFCR